jgi:hypothetical protein
VVNSLILFHAGHGDITVRPDIDRFDGNTVHFKDGTSGDYDLILAATGYKLHYPFIDKALLNWQGDAPHLFLNCMHPERDDLFVLGMVEASGPRLAGPSRAGRDGRALHRRAARRIPWR